MNREIKFRAFDKEAKTMHQVIVIGLEDKHLIYGHNNFYKQKSFDKIELMQFTGLHDKNGKEIYEGDVLKHRGHHRMEASVVVFSDGCFNVGYHYGSSTKVKPMLINSKVEIIGNIYENPELLKNETP